MSTGLVGIWEGTLWEDAMDASCATTLRIHCDASGKAKITYDKGDRHIEALGSWWPSGDGMTLRMQQSVAYYLNNNQDYSLYPLTENPQSGKLRGSLLGLVTFTQVETYWKADFQSASEADFDVQEGVLVDYRGAETDLAIPGDLGITAIAEEAFFLSDLTRVEIPEGVSAIKAGAFQQSQQLCEVILPKSLRTIGNNAFDGCSALAEIDLPEGLEWIGEQAFRETTSLTSIHLPESLLSIGKDAFYDCTALLDVEIPFGLKALNAHVFSGCQSLRSVVLPSGLQSIGEGAFSYCSNLAELALPEGLERIDRNAFNGCTGLTQIVLPASLQSIAASSFPDAENLTAIVTPNSDAEVFCSENGIRCEHRAPEAWDFLVTDGALLRYNGNRAQLLIGNSLGASVIGAEAFANHSELRTTILDAGIQKIGMGAFRNCSGLNAIYLPQTLTEIEADAFAGCDAVTFYVWEGSFAHNYCVQNGLTFALQSDRNKFVVEDGRLLEYLGSAQDIVIPDDMGIVAIGAKLFYENETLRSVAIPEGVTQIEFSAFESCSALEGVVLPSSVHTIGSNAFQDCAALKTVNLPDGIREIQEGTFRGCEALTELALPSTLQQIHDHAMEYCRGLTSLVIPEGIQRIPSYAFYGCSALTELALPSTLRDIGDNAFADCKNLSSIEIPFGVESLYRKAFDGCEKLGKVQIPSSVTHIDDEAFANCANVVLIVEANSAAKIYAQNMQIPYELASAQTAIPEAPMEQFEYSLGEDGSITILRYIGQDEYVQVPSQHDGHVVAYIGAEAFAKNPLLRQVNLPEGIREIGDMAFFGCGELHRVTLPQSAQSFGQFMFANCPKLILCVPSASAAESYALGTNLPYTNIDS